MSGDACGHRSVCLKKEMDVHVCNFFSLCNFLMESVVWPFDELASHTL